MQLHTCTTFCRQYLVLSSQYLVLLTVAILVPSVQPLPCSAADVVRALPDLEYARADDISLKLDLYIPANVKSPPVVVWVHGGAWRGGSKNNPSILPLTEKGFA